MANVASTKFGIELDDQVSDPADQAARALQNLQRRIDDDTSAIAQMNRAMKNLKAATTPNIAEITKLQEAITAKRNDVAAATTKMIEQGGSLVKLRSHAGSAARGIKDLHHGEVELLDVAKQLPGAFGQGARAAESFGSKLGGGTLAAIVAITTAIVALVVATYKAVKAFGDFANKQADLRRAELLHLQGVVRLRTAYTYGLVRARDSAEGLQTAIDQVSGSVAIGRDEVVSYATQLQRLGLRGENFKSALAGIAQVASVQGSEQAGYWAQWYQMIALTGGSVQALTRRLDREFGPIARARMLELGVQTEKLHENIAILFSGIKQEPLLRARQQLYALVSQSTVWGQSLKRILTNAMAPYNRLTELALLATKRFFQGVIIGAIKVETGFWKLAIVWRKTFGKSSLGDVTKAFNLFVYAGIGALLLIAAVAVVIGGVFALFGALTYAWFKILEFFYDITVDWFKQLADYDWESLGKAVGNGILEGLKSTWGAVTSVVEGLAADIARTFRQALRIQSPSGVFADLAMEIPRGIALGIKRGTPELDATVRHLVSIPREASSPAQDVQSINGSTRDGNRSVNVEVGELHVHADRNTDAAAVGHAIKRELEALLHGVATQLGTGHG